MPCENTFPVREHRRSQLPAHASYNTSGGYHPAIRKPNRTWKHYVDDIQNGTRNYIKMMLKLFDTLTGYVKFFVLEGRVGIMRNVKLQIPMEAENCAAITLVELWMHVNTIVHERKIGRHKPRIEWQKADHRPAQLNHLPYCNDNACHWMLTRRPDHAESGFVWSKKPSWLFSSGACRSTSRLHSRSKIQQNSSQRRLLKNARPIQIDRGGIFFQRWCCIQNEISLSREARYGNAYTHWQRHGRRFGRTGWSKLVWEEQTGCTRLTGLVEL